MTRDLSFDLAEHAAAYPATAVPADVAAHLVADLVDTIGVALGGFNAPGVPETRAWFAESSAAGRAVAWGSGLRLHPAAAAAANATAAHALDYDDTLDEGGGMHAGSVVHAAALATADALGGVTGEQYVAATAVGLDVAVRLALAPTQDFGWHRTSAFGIFGATVAVGRLRGLDAEQMRNALGIAYSQASGNRQCIPDGSLSKRLQAGFAARDAITAVELAARGLTGAHRAFEGQDGFFRLYQRDAWTRETVTDGLGEKLLSVRISTKPYPCGRNLHTIIDAALAIRERAGNDGIDRVEIGLPAAALARSRREYPQHVVEAQFSAPFVVALALATGTTPLAAFDEPANVDPAVKALFERIKLVEGANDDGSPVVTVHYAGGRTERAGDAVAKGNPAKPLTRDELEAKVLDAVVFAGEPITRERAKEVVEAGLALASAANTTSFTALLRAEGSDA